MISVMIQSAAFDVAAEMQHLRQGRTDIGALVTFTGLVRDVSTMVLEHYPAMSLREIKSIAAEAENRWPLLGGTVIHRYGTLYAGDEIVLVAITSRHRDAAFQAASFLMDWLKTKAPFWKQEAGGDWVVARAEDAVAANRWQPAKNE